MALVYAGGDVVRGGSTVILAMRDGRAAAESIDKALNVSVNHSDANAAEAEVRG